MKNLWWTFWRQVCINILFSTLPVVGWTLILIRTFCHRDLLQQRISFAFSNGRTMHASNMITFQKWGYIISAAFSFLLTHIFIRCLHSDQLSLTLCRIYFPRTEIYIHMCCPYVEMGITVELEAKKTYEHHWQIIWNRAQGFLVFIITI